MTTKMKFLLLSILSVAFFMFSCDEEEDLIVESEVLVEFLESAESPLMKDYVNSDMPSIIKASDLKADVEAGNAYVIDVRAAADYDTAHIVNAVNVALGDVLTHVEAADLSAYSKIVMVCYTGQSAGFATTILRIMEYDNVFSLKWGMCSWHENLAAKWKNAIASGNAYAAQFETTANNKSAAGDLPELSTGKATGLDILKDRVNAVLAEGYGPAKIDNKTVFDNLNDYYIVNYWPATQYADPGHIPGAIQYTPKESMKLAADLKTLPTDKTIVLYCYTGQTSSFLAAYLRVLGYDAKSLLFGTNAMIYDKMVEKSMTTFNDDQIMGYEYTN